MEISVKVRLREILDAPWISSWEYICERYGINPWCINEGLANSNDVIEITIDDAKKIGLLNNNTTD